MEEFLLFVEKMVWSMPLVLLLIFTHLFFTLKLKFPQRYTLKGIKLMLKSDKKNSREGISSFKSMMSVLAATLGTGNIIGVASAIIIGGIGSIFWIFISGVLAISTKYAETYIVLKYRKKDKNGSFGGTMYVLDEQVGKRNIAVIFAILLIISTFGMGALIQSNAISTTIIQNFDVNIQIISIIITFLCAYVIFGDEKRISNISSVLIPIAVIIYLFSCIILLFLFRDNIILAIKNIISEALNFKAVSGGIFSSLAICAMSSGLSKGLFTNEAGMGTSPIFDSTVKEKNITKQSVISSTTVFIDTVFLCTITGIIFVASGLYMNFTNPVEFAQSVFSLIPFGNYLFIFSIVVFAISTIPCSSYYGSIGIKYLFKSKKIYVWLYKIIYITMVYIGTLLQVKEVWSISSIANAIMILPNIYMLYYLKDEILLKKDEIKG